MKYFSLTYSLTAKDYESYEKKMFFTIVLGRLKQLIFPFLIMTVFSVFIDVSLTVISVCLFIIAMILPNMANREFSKSTRKKSKLIRKPMTIDFYSDHFEVISEPDMNMKGYSVRHYGFDTVLSVLESDEYFYFIFKTNNILIIPKNILSQEQFGMIKNLIDNLFAKIYKAI